MTQLLGHPMRLGVDVDLHPGEWLHSAISRWAWEIFAVPRSAMFHAFGLRDLPVRHIESIGNRLSVPIARNIAEATGLDEELLHDATMARLDGVLLRLDGTRVTKRSTWSWQAGTRYCPDCLRERPGVFLIAWRSPWVFACLQHRRILLDGCPSCMQAVVEMRGRNTDLFNPSTCRASVAPRNATRRVPCRAFLADSWEEVDGTISRIMLHVQREILQAVRDGDAEELRLLQSAATGFRGVIDINFIGRLAGLEPGELRGLFDAEKHSGLSAPRSAQAMGALITAAWMLARSDEDFGKSVIRAVTFSRPPAYVPRGIGYGPGSPNELLVRWGDATPQFRAKILRALDQDLTITQRVHWNTAVNPAALAQRPAPAAAKTGRPEQPAPRRSRYIPDLLWPRWLSRLDVGGGVKPHVLAAALSTALRQVGQPQQDGLRGRLAEVLRAPMLGSDLQTRQILETLSELAYIVDNASLRIDYASRRGIVGALVFTQRHWRLIARNARIRGYHEYNSALLRDARRYAWLRMTSASPERLPSELRLGRQADDTYAFTQFRMRMTRELQEEIDDYGSALLRHRGVAEPVIWTPETTIDLTIPGHDISDLDVDKLHAMLGEGVFRQRHLAKELGVSPQRVMRAIDAFPPSTGHRREAIDWDSLFAGGPKRVSDQAQTTEP